MNTKYTATSITGETIIVRATTIDEAANIVARRKHGRNASAARTTGCCGLSGYFQAYRPVRGGGMSSVGRGFHLTVA